MTLYLVGEPGTERVPVGWLHVDAKFLAAVISHYVRHPGDRVAIGTNDEMERLRSIIVTPSVPAR